MQHHIKHPAAKKPPTSSKTNTTSSKHKYLRETFVFIGRRQQNRRLPTKHDQPCRPRALTEGPAQLATAIGSTVAACANQQLSGAAPCAVPVDHSTCSTCYPHSASRVPVRQACSQAHLELGCTASVMQPLATPDQAIMTTSSSQSHTVALQHCSG